MTTYHSNGTQDQSSDPAQAGLRDKVREQVDARMKDAANATEDARKKVGAHVSRANQESVRFVKENPALALAGAVGVGILIGLAVRGRG